MLPKVQLPGFDCFAIRSVESDRWRRTPRGAGSSIRRISRGRLLTLVWIVTLAIDAAAQAIQPSASAAEELTWHAFAQWGAPYRWGGTDPVGGFDCSGLVRWVARQAFSVQLPRRTEEIAAVLPAVSRASLSTGDLVFFNTLGRPYSHVGIYIGDGQFIHAPAGKGRVRIESMQLTYWQGRFNGARRLASPGDALVTDDNSTGTMPSRGVRSADDDLYGGS